MELLQAATLGVRSFGELTSGTPFLISNLTVDVYSILLLLELTGNKSSVGDPDARTDLHAGKGPAVLDPALLDPNKLTG
jgi:hypothetical protein